MWFDKYSSLKNESSSLSVHFVYISKKREKQILFIDQVFMSYRLYLMRQYKNWISHPHKLWHIKPIYVVQNELVLLE